MDVANNPMQLFKALSLLRLVACPIDVSVSEKQLFTSRCLGFYTACVSHVGRGQSALLAHARTKVLPHLAGTATQAHTWWFADTQNWQNWQNQQNWLAELAELSKSATAPNPYVRTPRPTLRKDANMKCLP